MFKLKPLTKAGIPQAMEKAERYRLLNEPAQAESICMDVLHTDPDNQEALIVLLLSVTDQFREAYSAGEKRAQEILEQMEGDYERSYYGGIVSERMAKAKLDQDAPYAKYIAYGLFERAMEQYEEAERLRPAGNDDALLRWNTCVRMITHYKLEPGVEEKTNYTLE